MESRQSDVARTPSAIGDQAAQCRGLLVDLLEHEMGEPIFRSRWFQRRAHGRSAADRVLESWHNWVILITRSNIPATLRTAGRFRGHSLGDVSLSGRMSL